MRERIVAGLAAAARIVFSRRILIILKVSLIDILFQTRLFNADRLRWFSHFCLAGGFILLLLMHALDEVITMRIFPDYASTRNPYLFLRNLFGGFVLLGIILSFYRRFLDKKLRLVTGGGDRFAIIILAVIIVSGFALESLKIISYPVFDEMVENYSGIEDADEIKSLEAYWSEEYGVIFSNRKVLASQELLKAGREIHEANCAGCHSRPSAAFISEPLARVISPGAAAFNRLRIDTCLYYFHFLACFIGLAYLPFSKFFHIIAVPACQIIQGIKDRESPEGAGGRKVRRIGLDACTHCGICTIHCSVAPIVRIIPNANILPSEKIAFVKAMYFGKYQDNALLELLSRGNLICTECYRCSELCPSGIGLQELWLGAKKDLADQGFPEPHVWIRCLTTAQWAEKIEAMNCASHSIDKEEFQQNLLSNNIESFSPCIQCTICTSVCPVVNATENPDEELDYTPQQIMNLLRLSMREFALGSRMIWNCVTCYMCQENCPQGIRVADILYELRNIACDTLGSIRTGTYVEGKQFHCKG